MIQFLAISFIVTWIIIVTHMWKRDPDVITVVFLSFLVTLGLGLIVLAAIGLTMAALNGVVVWQDF